MRMILLNLAKFSNSQMITGSTSSLDNSNVYIKPEKQDSISHVNQCRTMHYWVVGTY